MNPGLQKCKPGTTNPSNDLIVINLLRCNRFYKSLHLVLDKEITEEIGERVSVGRTQHADKSVVSCKPPLKVFCRNKNREFFFLPVEDLFPCV